MMGNSAYWANHDKGESGNSSPVTVEKYSPFAKSIPPLKELTMVYQFVALREN